MKEVEVVWQTVGPHTEPYYHTIEVVDYYCYYCGKDLEEDEVVSIKGFANACEECAEDILEDLEN